MPSGCGSGGGREGGRKIDPAQREGLDEIGFAWDITQYKWDRFVLPSLRRFYELNGHLGVPSSYRVPRGSPDWPKHLGSKVNNILQRGDFIEQVKADQDELERLNFDVGLALSSHKSREKVVPAHTTSPDMELGVIRNDPEWKWSERIMPAFEAFHRLHGHCRVPTRFVVPSDERWPKLSWGLKLGIVVDNIRNRGTYSTQISRDKTRLVEMGFVWDLYESEWSERIMPALETFYRLQGHCRVPQSFVVPSDGSWPRLSWGLNLGTVVNSIRQGAYFTQVLRDKTRVKELGFVWDFYEAEWSERIVPRSAD
ncbi:hypothetical protein PHYSODRAFT_362379 [Phytophthora sojae]|uniref:Uncharacterized protein n=1 Tax=Phytophthora sojae (strain P6497) TaxID=1094619 RepID=G5ACL9_PHYSP|nr:hypothetical protein PHYSODRAFT_362379 [Phytophthora sojae]EGZ07093.1 hypothetical protein PHYSODRAFT_362379 [Phytophthora sojae]|eukprot:XP_009537857.1 hypothetical protein PHYSODRAFT_362379 [Phytophthora sojae]